MAPSRLTTPSTFGCNYFSSRTNRLSAICSSLSSERGDGCFASIFVMACCSTLKSRYKARLLVYCCNLGLSFPRRLTSFCLWACGSAPCSFGFRCSDQTRIFVPLRFDA